MKTIRLAVVYATILMILGITVFQIFPAQLLELFQSEEDVSGDLLAIGIPALRLISIAFLMAGFDVVCSSVFQALDHGVLSLTVSLVRQLVVLLPVAYLLAHTFGLGAVWLSFPISELICCVLCAVFLLRVHRRDVSTLQPREA